MGRNQKSLEWIQTKAEKYFSGFISYDNLNTRWTTLPITTAQQKRWLQGQYRGSRTKNCCRNDSRKEATKNTSDKAVDARTSTHARRSIQ